MGMANVQCFYCGKSYLRNNSAYNEAVKLGRKQYCSSECKAKGHKSGEIKNCLTCKKEIFVNKCLIKKSKTGNFFCSQTCAAKHTNINRRHSELTKDKIRKKTIINFIKKGYKISDNKIKKCLICQHEFKSNNCKKFTCSRKCCQIYQFGSLPYSKEEVILKIKEIANSLGRTPEFREVEGKFLSAARKFFGTWNKLMISAGLNPNTKWLCKSKRICNDGDISDSLSEMIIDNWFFRHGIKHTRSKHYPNSKKNCDFYLTDYDVWVEYFGLIGGPKRYDEVVKLKKRIAEENNLNLICLTREDIVIKGRLEEIFCKYKTI